MHNISPQLNLILFVVGCYENRKQTTSLSLFDLCSLILFSFLYYGKLFILKDVLFRLFSPRISKEMICVLTGGTRKVKMLRLKTEKAMTKLYLI